MNVYYFMKNGVGRLQDLIFLKGSRGNKKFGNHWSKVFERLVSVRLGRFMKRSGVLPNTHHWRVGSYRPISVQPLIGPIIREFCISSVLWVFKVL